jgi:hypothetical protein
LLITNSNNAPTYTWGGSVTVTQIVTASSRITAWKVVPSTTGITSFTLTLGTSSVLEWWIGNYSGADLSATVYNATNSIGNSTSSSISVPTTTLGYIATGNEVAVSAGGVNSTATWTTDGNTIFHTTANNAALMIDAFNMTAGELSTTFASMDRGSNGSNRNQNSLSLVLQPLNNNATPNLLSNPSFENGSTIATSWTDEHTTVTQATYSLTATGVVDGGLAQQFTYTGVSGDGGTAKTEIYQSPVTGVAPGYTIQFSVYLSGLLTNVYGFIGIEAFDSGNTYISEADTNFTVLTGTPTYYSVEYICPPLTDHVAVYLQVPNIGATSAMSITMDKAILVILSTKPPSPNLMTMGVG